MSAGCDIAAEVEPGGVEPGGLPASRFGPATAAAAVLFAALFSVWFLPGVALAKDGQVTVRAAGTTNASVTIKLSDLGSNDINNREYRLRSGRATISGHSLLQVMNAADAESSEIDVATIPAIEIDRPGSGKITVSGDDMRNPSAFADGPPVFYEDNGATVFVMPGSDGAAGGRYRFVFAPVGISVASDARYGVDLTASRTKIKAGRKVSFNATVTGEKAGEDLAFDWNFGDGKSRQTSNGRIGHVFSSDGDFSVILDVTGPSGSGQSAVLIEVGPVKEADNKDTNPQKQPEGNQGSGGLGTGTGGTGDGYGTGLGGYGYGTGPGGYGTGTGGGLPGGTFEPAPGDPPASPAAPEPDPAKPASPDDGLVEVQGELVDPATGATVVAPTDGQVVESADPAPSGTGQGGFGLPGEAWTLAGVGLLLGLGGFAELRVFSRPY